MTGCTSSVPSYEENTSSYDDTEGFSDSDYEEEYDDTELNYVDYDDSDWDDDDDDSVNDANHETVTEDDLVSSVLTPFFGLVQEQAMDDSCKFAPTHISNLITYVYGSNEYNTNITPASFDDRIWVVREDDDYYETYFSGLHDLNRSAVEWLCEYRREAFDDYYTEVEVLNSNFPEESTEFNYVKGTQSEIKMIIKVTYNVYRDRGSDTLENAYYQYYFVSLKNAGNREADYKSPWKLTGVFTPMDNADCVKEGNDGKTYFKYALYMQKDAPSEFFDLTPLTDEW